MQDPWTHDTDGQPPSIGGQPDDTRWYAGDDPTGEFPRINLRETPPGDGAPQRDNKRWES